RRRNARPAAPARDRPPRRHPPSRASRSRTAEAGTARAAQPRSRARRPRARDERQPLVAEASVRLAFLGTPEVAVPPLRMLVREGHDVALVVSQPDRKRGRGGALVASPVKAAALELGLPVTDRVDDVLGVGAELGVVVA